MYAPAPDAAAAAPAVAEDALLYVFQNDNDKGFIIVSGDDVFSPIIGISDKGAYDPANLPPNFAWYIGNIEREMEFALENGQAQTQDIREEWVLYAAGAAYIVGEYLVKTQWNQRAPYWNQTPMIDGVQTLTGCVATTMAQIMNYHKYPTSTTGTIPAYTSRGGLSVLALSPVTFNWANMTNDAIATLMSVAGRSVEMDYGTSESGAYSKDVPSALMTYFDYDYRVQYIQKNNIGSDWENILKGQIDLNLPVYYSGTGSSGGHAFVLDGYDNIGRFHFNWGWGGSHDGWFIITVLNPSSYNFSSDQAAVINIKPSDSPGNNLVYKAANGGTYVLQADFIGTNKLTGQLNVNGNFTLDLNGHTLTIEIPSGGNNGIKIASGKTFTVKDSRSGGILNVSNKEMNYVYPIGGSAAINTTDGTLIIESGTVNAEGGRGAAGIGGGYGASGGNVTITGGTVNAIGGYSGGAGIGGGIGGTVSGITYNAGAGGTITIAGGTVTAIGGKSEGYSNSGAGIGGGHSGGAGGNVTINGGIVTATATGNYAAGIGGGNGGAGGNVAINGGMVTATGGGSARGIGYGHGSTDIGTLTMNGNALVFANSVDDASAKTSGILVNGSITTWYGNNVITLSPIQYTIPSSRTLTIQSGKTLKIPSNATLTVPSGATLTVPSGATITNNGTVIPEDNSTIAINGTRTGNLIVGANVSNLALASESGASIEINTATLLANTGQTVEYAKNTIATQPTSDWQTGTVFANLNEESEYYIFARSKANTNFAAGAPKMLIAERNRIPKATDLIFTIPTNHIYNGAMQGIGNVTGTGMGVITVLYNGSTTIPINAGTYNVTINVAGGENFDARVGIALGNYEIKAKSVTVTGVTAADKEYDGYATSTITGTAAVSGAINGDNVTVINGVASFADKNVGSGKIVVFSGFSLGGTDAENYTFSAQPTNITANITAKPVTITGVSANNKEYDGNTIATITGTTTINGVINGDNVSVTGGTALFANKNAGIGKTVVFSGFSLGGADASNYELVQPANTKANITAKPVTITGVSANSKEYNGNTTATVKETATIDGAINGDNVTVISGIALFADKNVGIGKIVELSGFSLGGTDAGNYTLSAQPANVTANITAKPVTITGVSANSKEYDGNTIATVTGTITVNGTINSDNVTVINGVASFTDKNVGTGKIVKLSGFSLGGADAVNYKLSAQPTNVTANITAKPVTITGVSANSKEYDGNTIVTVTGTATINGAINGDNVTVTDGTALFADKNAGTGKTIVFSGFSLGGADAGNYELAQPANTTADITPKPITITGVIAMSRAYNGTTVVQLTGGTLDGVVNDDDISFALGTGKIEDENIGDNKSTETSITLSGTDAGNYIFTQPTDIKVNITESPKTYTVTFIGLNGTELKTQTVNHGSSAAAPPVPVEEGYTFIGWIIDFDNVTSDLTVAAIYKENTPTHNPTAKSNFAIVQNGESIQIVGASQATPIRIYNLQGKVFMIRTAMPNESISVAHLPKGVYVVKAGGETVKVVR